MLLGFKRILWVASWDIILTGSRRLYVWLSHAMYIHLSSCTTNTSKGNAIYGGHNGRLKPGFPVGQLKFGNSTKTIGVDTFCSVNRHGFFCDAVKSTPLPYLWSGASSYATVNHLTPNGHYMGHTAQLTSRCFILYIYSTNIRTEYFKHAA